VEIYTYLWMLKPKMYILYYIVWYNID
jgi:hypothetical protein